MIWDYKNYINHFRRTNKIDSLRTIFNYNKKYNLEDEVTEYEEEYTDTFQKWSDSREKIKINVIIFQLLRVIREIIINAEKIDKEPLKNYNFFSKAINKWKEFSESLESYEDFDIDKLQQRLWIMGHDQFHLQKINNNLFDFINTFYWIYSDEELNKHILRKFWINIIDIYAVSIWFFLILNQSKNFFIDLKAEETIRTFGKDVIDFYIEKFTISLEDATKELKDERNSININCEKDFKNYWLGFLLNFPIFEFEWRYFSPIHQLIINKVTNYLYFSIIEWNKLWKEFWDANERYIYSILQNKKDSYQLVNVDDEFEKESKKVVHKNKLIDFIIFSEQEWIILFECKSNPLSYKSKIEWIQQQDLERIIEALFQLYFWINNLLINKSYTWINNIDISHIPVLPILSYIFPPYINFWQVRIKVIELLKGKLESEWINPDLVTQFPFLIIDNTMYHHLVHILNTIWINEFIKSIIESDPENTENEIIIMNLYEKHEIDREIPFYDKMKVIDIVLTEHLKSK